MIARKLLLFALVSIVSGRVARAATTLTAVRFSPDVATVFGAVTVPTNGIVEETIATSNMTIVSIGAIPDGVSVDGYAIASNGDQLLSFDTTVTLGGTTFQPFDVVRYNGSTYSLEFDGQAAGVPDGTNVGDIAVDGTGLLLTFDTTVVLSGTTFSPRDVVLYNGSTFTMYFNGGVQNVPDGMAIDGVELLANGHLLLSFDTSGTLGGVDFDDEDILEYTPNGATWEMAYDGSARWPNWPASNLRAFAAFSGSPAAPNGVSSTAITTTRIDLSWTIVPSATSYQVDRKSAGGGYVQIGTPAGNSFSDTTASPLTAYLYRVRAVSSGGVSDNSAPDLATTVVFTDRPLVAGVVVKAVHLSEIRAAVNAVRALAALSAATFTDTATAGTTIKAVHITQIRSALDLARSALGFSTGGYTDGSLSGVAIKAIHFQELRNRIQ